MTQTYLNHDLCWGDQSLAELPRACSIGMPVLVDEPYGHSPMRHYEGIVQMLLGRGVRVPDHPAACQAQADGTLCGHARVWHKQRTKLHPCEIAGCGCLDYVRRSPR
jgi:hypothetical protein